MEITDEKLEKFNQLIAEWLKEGKMRLEIENRYSGEPTTKETVIFPLLEFSAGAERIDNINGTFTWRDLFDMVEEQELLK